MKNKSLCYKQDFGALEYKKRTEFLCRGDKEGVNN